MLLQALNRNRSITRAEKSTVKRKSKDSRFSEVVMHVYENLSDTSTIYQTDSVKQIEQQSCGTLWLMQDRIANEDFVNIALSIFENYKNNIILGIYDIKELLFLRDMVSKFDDRSGRDQNSQAITDLKLLILVELAKLTDA